MKSKASSSRYSLPQGLIPWTARFSGNCMCGRRIRQGQNCLWDKNARKLICHGCSKLPQGTLDERRGTAAVAKVMDRIKQIYVMPKTRSDKIAEELQQLLTRLRIEFAMDYSARRLICEVMQLRIDGNATCIAMKYAEKCHGCAEKQVERTAAVWCKASHRIWCLECYATHK